MSKKSYFKKQDICLLVGILLVAGLGSLLLFFWQGKSGDILKVTLDGKYYGEYPLHTDRVIAVEEKDGKNVIQIKDATVFVEEADCPDKYCVKHNPISHANETIVCLPHKLVLTIETDEKKESPIDTLAQ